ncbi:restriction endonuclease subunit S [Faecalibacillus intestinalis]|uniref:restriction endonuclease subunit S n=1 Tax=Faecalibacillus intestinalis TaxID=1982626 RepID=UPI002FDACAFB
MFTWEQRKLRDEAIEILAGGDIDKEKTVENGKYPIYANALTNDGIVGYYDDYYRVTAPAVTVTGRGEVGYAKARMTHFTPVVRLLAVCSNHDCYFLENAINNHKVVVESTGVPQLTVPQLSSYNIFFPANDKEEVRIGKYFHTLDNLITLHQRECDQLKELKKSMLKKMFPRDESSIPEVRFAGFTDAWEQRKLGTLCSLITKGTTPKDKSGNGEVNFIKVENIDIDNGEITSTSKISIAEHEGYLKRSKLKENDILFSIAGTLGRVSVVKSSILPANTNQALAILRINEGYIPYLTTVLKGQAVEDFIRRNPTIGAQPNLSLEQVNNLDISYPNYDEQVRIGQYFSNLDHLITLHQRL